MVQTKVSMQNLIYPGYSMYGIFTYIHHKCEPNLGKYSIHGASGYLISTGEQEFRTETKNGIVLGPNIGCLPVLCQVCISWCWANCHIKACLFHLRRRFEPRWRCRGSRVHGWFYRIGCFGPKNYVGTTGHEFDKVERCIIQLII